VLPGIPVGICLLLWSGVRIGPGHVAKLALPGAAYLVATAARFLASAPGGSCVVPPVWAWQRAGMREAKGSSGSGAWGRWACSLGSLVVNGGALTWRAVAVPGASAAWQAAMQTRVL